MSAAEGEEIGLERAIANVYGGPLEEFVRRRDTLAKELRSAGRREDASAVKGLRKPSRMAWALDAAALEAAEALDGLVAAVAATLEAQAAGGDVRGAIASLRAAVREFAGHAARAAEQAGHRFDQPTLANAVLAVLGRPDAFSELRRGCLADVPEAGGLDFLTSLPAPPSVERAPKTGSHEPAAAPSPSPSPSAERADIDAAARQAVRQAEIALTAARDRSEEVQRALRDLESKLQAAEERLQQAEMEARALRDQRDRAREEMEEATARLREAEKAHQTNDRRHRLAGGKDKA